MFLSHIIAIWLKKRLEWEVNFNWLPTIVHVGVSVKNCASIRSYLNQFPKYYINMKSPIVHTSSEQTPKNMFCFSLYVFLLFFNTLDWESLFRLAFCKLLATETLLQMWKNCAENPTILIIPNMKKCFWRLVLERISVLHLGQLFAKPLLCARHWSGREGNKGEYDMNTEIIGKKPTFYC